MQPGEAAATVKLLTYLRGTYMRFVFVVVVQFRK